MNARMLAAMLAAILLPGQALAASAPGRIPALVDLRSDAVQAQREGKPIVLFFTLPDCQYCHVVRQHYLLPLLREPRAAARPIIREVDIASELAVTGWDGRATSQRGVAKDFRVRFAPTVMFLDANGRPLTEPVVGGDTAGLYGGYLDNAFAESAQKISAARRAEQKGEKP